MVLGITTFWYRIKSETAQRMTPTDAFEPHPHSPNAPFFNGIYHVSGTTWAICTMRPKQGPDGNLVKSNRKNKKKFD